MQDDHALWGKIMVSVLDFLRFVVLLRHPPKNCLEKGSGLEMHVSVPFADQCGRVTDDRAKRQGV